MARALRRSWNLRVLCGQRYRRGIRRLIRGNVEVGKEVRQYGGCLYRRSEQDREMEGGFIH